MTLRQKNCTILQKNAWKYLKSHELYAGKYVAVTNYFIISINVKPLIFSTLSFNTKLCYGLNCLQPKTVGQFKKHLILFEIKNGEFNENFRKQDNFTEKNI